MSASNELAPEQPRLLRTTELPDGRVSFTIERQTRGMDVLATFAFLKPDPIDLNECVSEFLRFGIEERDALFKAKIPVDSSRGASVADLPGISVDPLGDTYYMNFRDKPSFIEVFDKYSAWYGEEVHTHLRILLERLVDNSMYANVTFAITPSNQLSSATAEKIDRALSQLSFGPDVSGNVAPN